jgi:putative transposase
MSRRRRHSLPGAIYHVMIRGNNGQAIFSSDEERTKFCLLMQEGVERYGHKILAFCFMTNHIHLAIQLGEVSLSKVCQNLTFRYTRFFNRRHKGVGHLFQGRFKSILVNGNIYLKKLIRYIHLNPIRAKLVADPSEYFWSSHQFYLKQNECQWLARDMGLRFFGNSYIEALEQYSNFMVAGINQEDSIDFKNGIASGIIADDEFIESIEAKCINHTSVAKSSKIDLRILVEIIADWYGVNVQTISSLGCDRKASKIRAVIAYLVRYTEGITIKEVAVFCRRAENSMSQAATRLEIQMVSSDEIKNEIESLKQKLISLEKEHLLVKLEV